MRILALCCIAPFLGGCFFIYVPGSVTSAIGDSLTGMEGQHCVGEAVPVGAQIRLPNGSVGTVKKLEGTSSRCAEPGRPIRALVVVEEAPTARGPTQ